MNDDKEKICDICGYKVERILDFPLLDGSGRTEKRKVHCMCKCEIEKQKSHDARLKFEEEQRRIYQLRQLSLMDNKLKGINFNTYRVTEENRKVFNIAKKYVDNFDAMYKSNQGLFFYGDVGTGKSYTAAAIANELIEQKQSVIMTSFVKLLNELSGFDNDEVSYINRLNEARYLVIDDFGVERCTDFVLEKIYDIIDSRYRACKPLIVTTNVSLSQMKNCTDIRYNRIYDRIFEMCYPVKVGGCSWRKKEAAERFESMKKILEG